MQNKDISVIIFTNGRGEVLLQKKDLLYKRWPGRWSLPGGGVEENETPAETIRREVEEETGCDLEDEELFIVYDYADADRWGKMFVHNAEFKRPISDISIGEGAGFAFFAEEEIDGLNVIDHDLAILKIFFGKK
jgi:8-oxo-dGTP diphosphatase